MFSNSPKYVVIYDMMFHFFIAYQTTKTNVSRMFLETKIAIHESLFRSMLSVSIVWNVSQVFLLNVVATKSISSLVNCCKLEL